MRLAGKMTTLIKATLRMPTRLFSKPKDAESRLKTLEKELADIEAKEREIANLLKETRAKAADADTAGDATEADAQTRLAQKLETQLDTQSVQAITLSEKLKMLSQSLAKTPNAPEETPSTSHPSTIEKTETHGANDASKKNDLNARKSRLSD